MKICGFNVARADICGIGISKHRHLVSPRHVFPAVAVQRIHFDELREVRLRHGRANSPAIRRQPVARDLRICGNTLREVVAERIRGDVRSVANVPCDAQLRCLAQRNPSPNVAVMRGFLALVFLAASHERKQFVELHIVARKIPQMLVLIRTARLAGLFDERENRVCRRSGDSRRGAHAHSLAEHLENLSALFSGEWLHACVFSLHA